MKPVRLRLSRANGFRLQQHSADINGLPAVSVARPGLWGNPFKDDPHPARRYASEVAPGLSSYKLRQLRGKNLACWCPLDAECHADVLLELANPNLTKPTSAPNSPKDASPTSEPTEAFKRKPLRTRAPRRDQA